MNPDHSSRNNYCGLSLVLNDIPLNFKILASLARPFFALSPRPLYQREKRSGSRDYIKGGRKNEEETLMYKNRT